AEPDRGKTVQLGTRLALDADHQDVAASPARALQHRQRQSAAAADDGNRRVVPGNAPVHRKPGTVLKPPRPAMRQASCPERGVQKRRSSSARMKSTTWRTNGSSVWASRSFSAR